MKLRERSPVLRRHYPASRDAGGAEGGAFGPGADGRDGRSRTGSSSKPTLGLAGAKVRSLLRCSSSSTALSRLGSEKSSGDGPPKPRRSSTPQLSPVSGGGGAADSLSASWHEGSQTPRRSLRDFASSSGADAEQTPPQRSSMHGDGSGSSSGGRFQRRSRSEELRPSTMALEMDTPAPDFADAADAEKPKRRLSASLTKHMPSRLVRIVSGGGGSGGEGVGIDHDGNGGCSSSGDGGGDERL